MGEGTVTLRNKRAPHSSHLGPAAHGVRKALCFKELGRSEVHCQRLCVCVCVYKIPDTE